jgi:transcriptional antiterminator
VNKMEEKIALVCPNKACGKVFNKPLKTQNLKGSKEHYNACPYCLAEITINEMEGKNPPEKTDTEATFSNSEPSKKEEKSFTCKHYSGYMSEKEHRQQFPEECMICRELIECMNKKTTT